MRIRYPSSFLKLLLIGFAFATLPLLLAFINANIAFDKLAKQSELTISNAVETTRAGRVLQEQLHLMERGIRQYFVLQDDVLFSNYQQANSKFNAATMQLEQHTTNTSLQEKLHTLTLQTKQLNIDIVDAKNTYAVTLGFLDNFDLLSQQIEAIISENNRAIDSASTQLRRAALKTQRNLFLQSLVLIPLTLLMAAAITFLLARPIRRMDNAIRSLGEGQLDAPISIDGPGDLRVLGQRLDWLRGELKDLNIQKQQFLRHVSHELKTPLTAIREATELLNDGIGGALTTQQAEITHILRDNSVRLQKMIENLLNYTRVEALQPKLNLQGLEIPSLINKVIDAHALSIRNKQIETETHFDVQEVIADGEKLTIILDNLISNAVKYTPDAGHIKVSAARDKKWLMIEVQDSGPGLAKEDQDKLFDPFYRGSAINKSLISSSGLGLTIAKDLVEIHGGNISLLPPEIGTHYQGAHFVVQLPIGI
ncbi:MAG: ATP-binding protein [Methylophilaceae bacterium]